MLLSFSLVLLAALASAEQVWRASTRAEVLDALVHAAAGDTIELEPGEYVFSALGGGGNTAPLAIDKSLTIQSRVPTQRATLRTSDSSFLFTITASDVKLQNLIVGRQVIGGDERSIDVFIGAGTQAAPATSRLAYNVAANAKRSIPSQSEILVARSLYGSESTQSAAHHEHVNKRMNERRSAPPAANAETLRALQNVQIVNVDFTRSRSGTNIAFSRGSYADVSVTRCAFGRAGATYINSLVAAADARFRNLAVHYNQFVDTEVLFGGAQIDVHSFDTNSWTPAQAQIFIGGVRQSVATYCIDSACSTLAPVVDLDTPNSVYASLEDAVAAGATHLRVVDDIAIARTIAITRDGTTIEGGEGCSGAPIVSIARGASIVSFNGALSGVRNLRFSLVDADVVAFVFTDGVAQTLGVAKFAESLLTETNGAIDNTNAGGGATVIFDGVSFLGTDTQTQVGILLNSPRVRVEAEDTLLAQITLGLVAHRGVIVTSSTTVFGASTAGIYAETSTRQAGIRVSDSTFIDCEAPVQLGANGGAANLREFRISCSQFLFNRRANPIDSKDCLKLPALCADALTYNTIVTDFDDVDAVSSKVPIPEAVRAERRMLRSGMNHVEGGRDRTQFVYFGNSNEFSLRDSQGRLSAVHGVISGGGGGSNAKQQRAFLLATYAPLRAECMPLDAPTFGSMASVVSSVLEVRSDALLHECAALSASFTIANDTLLPALADVAIYGVMHLGAQPTWSREHTVSHTPSADSAALGAVAIVETSLSLHDEADRHTHRVVVISHAPLPDAVAHALATGSAKTIDTQRVVSRALCVACGNAVIPAYLIDAHCGGSSENIRSQFDAAYKELGFGTSTAPRQDAIALFLYGACETRQCTITLDQNEIIEGASMIVRGSLFRNRALKCDANKPIVQFSERSSKAAMRYISLEGAPSDTQGACAVLVAPGGAAVVPGPTIAYCSINGALCVDSRAGGRYIGNDFVSEHVAVLFNFKQTPTKKHSEQPVIFEANRVSLGNVHYVGLPTTLDTRSTSSTGGGASQQHWEVRADRNTFGTRGNGFASSGEMLSVVISNGKAIGLLENDASKSSRFTATRNELSSGAVLNLHQSAQVAFAPNSIGQNSTVLLDDTVHVSDIAFDAASMVMIPATASVVLRQVLFEDVAATLLTTVSPASCEGVEKSTTGIDALRSTIFSGTGDRIFTQQQVSVALAAGSSQYFAPNGSLVQCADGAQRVRDEHTCACANEIVDQHQQQQQQQQQLIEDISTTTTTTTAAVATNTPAVAKHAQRIKAAQSVKFAEVELEGAAQVQVQAADNNNNNDASDASDSNGAGTAVGADNSELSDDEPFLPIASTTSSERRGFGIIWIALLVFAAILFICLGVFCCMRYNTFATTTVVATTAKMGERPSARSSSSTPLLGNNNTSSSSSGASSRVASAPPAHNSLAHHLDALTVDPTSPLAMSSHSTSLSSESSHETNRKKAQRRVPKKQTE